MGFEALPSLVLIVDDDTAGVAWPGPYKAWLICVCTWPLPAAE